MTARPLRKTADQRNLRVLGGRKFRRPAVAPWMIMALIGTTAFLGLGFARTSLDSAAFELAELEQAIVEEQAVNRQLSLEIARLENPARIAPLAEEMGLVVPVDTKQILVDLDPDGPVIAAKEGNSNQ